MGFHTVAVSSGESKRELALSLGATEYLDGSKVDLVKEFEKLGGAKVIVCTAPNPKAYQGLLPGLAVDGTLLLLGITLEEAKFNTGEYHSHALRDSGAYFGCPQSGCS